jgi:hypothetical protein
LDAAVSCSLAGIVGDIVSPSRRAANKLGGESESAPAAASSPNSRREMCADFVAAPWTSKGPLEF